MDIAGIIKIIGPEIEPSIEGAVVKFWPQICIYAQSEIALIPNELLKSVVGAIFAAQAPLAQSFVIAELKKYLLPA